MESLSFCEPIQAELVRVHRRIEQLLTSPQEQIQQCLSAMTERTGKMLRPCLVLLSGQCLAPIVDEHIDLAAMVELVHRASLLHDDVIDAAKLRRSGKTANALWGNTAAVLLGDFLLSKAFSLGAKINPRANEIMNLAAQQLCTGELLQNFQCEQWDLTESQYYTIIDAKTAALFQSSCQLGAVASSGTDQQIQLFGEFGRELGIAFQIADDLLDLQSTQEKAGKTLGTDLRQGKLTLPLIHWIQSGTQDKDRCIEMIADPNHVQEVIEALKQSQSLDYAVAKVKHHSERAAVKLCDFKHTPAGQAMLSLTEYVAGRV